MGKSEEIKPCVAEDCPLVECECGEKKFHLWVDGGIWYAYCLECWREYGLFPNGFFRLLRDPQDEAIWGRRYPLKPAARAEEE